MKNIFLRLLSLVVMAGIITAGIYFGDFLAPAGTAFAVGDLTIDWGVPDGSPIFTVTDFAPGETESRNVDVINNAATSRSLAVRGTHTAGNGISDQLNIVILADGSPVYGTGSGTGPKSLTQFFADSAGPDGIVLLTLSAGADTTLTFAVTFNDQAQNPLQGDSVTLDITLGIGFDLPTACEAITFAGDPIFGTQGRDAIRGTNGNDLIITFEGNDSVRGGGGDDCIIGGAGNDNLRGDAGNDFLVGEGGNDSLRGDSGNDNLDGGEGNDNLRGDAGNDQLVGGGGNDQLRGDAGADHLEGGAGNDSMRGDGGNDTLLGGTEHDTARGDGGTDQCEAEVKHSCEL